MAAQEDPSRPVVVKAIYDKAPLTVERLRRVEPMSKPTLLPDGRAARDRASTAVPEKLPEGLRKADLSQAPFDRGGRLHVYWASAGKDVHCTAECVGTDTLLLTAGHCVRWAGQWNRNLRFYRAFDDGRFEDGTAYEIDWIGIPNGWFARATSDDIAADSWQWDFAVLRLRRACAIGCLALGRLDDRLEAWSSIGYPENAGGGREMYVADGERGPSPFPGTVGMSPNPMKFGSSGGAWCTLAAAGAPRMVGLNSFNLASEPDSEYGPVFDDTVQALVRHMAGLGAA